MEWAVRAAEHRSPTAERARLRRLGASCFISACQSPPCYLLLAATALLLLPTTRGAVETTARSSLAFVGTYTGAKSRGNLRVPIRARDRQRRPLGPRGGDREPIVSRSHPNGRFLYAVNETGNFQGKPAGSVTALAIDQATGRLRQLNQASTLGGGPCHLHRGPRREDLVIVANYGGGSVAVLPIRANGAVGTASAFVQHHGSSVNRQRQEAPHAHGATLSPDERFLFVPDLGLDRLVTCRFNHADGTLTPGDPPFTALKPGSGPRHLVFAPNGQQAYAVSELVSTVTEFTFDAVTGRLTEKAVFPLLPADSQGQSTAAELAVHPNGRFLYASNRGHDSLAVFAIARSGALELIERLPSGGRTPRHFALDPTGRWLWAANQDSNDIVVFRVDANTGRLEAAGRKLEVGAPVCVCFSSWTRRVYDGARSALRRVERHVCGRFFRGRRRVARGHGCGCGRERRRLRWDRRRAWFGRWRRGGWGQRLRWRREGIGVGPGLVGASRTGDGRCLHRVEG